MTIGYDRRWEILVNDVVFIEQTDGPQFKVVFEIKHDPGGFTSYADISIYNLTDSTAKKILKKGNSITFKAGYVDTIDSIFKGTIKNAFKERDGGSVITRILALGGQGPEVSSMNTTLGKNTTVEKVIRTVVKAMGLSIVIQTNDFSTLPKIIGGYNLEGDPRKLLDDLATAFKFSYVSEGDSIVIIKDGGVRAGSSVIPVNILEGMEGIPEISEVGANVSVRLNPRLRVGGQIDIQSNLKTFNFNNVYYQDVPEQSGSGIYNVLKLAFSGDSWGSKWTAKVEGLAPQ